MPLSFAALSFFPQIYDHPSEMYFVYETQSDLPDRFSTSLVSHVTLWLLQRPHKREDIPHPTANFSNRLAMSADCLLTNVG